LNDKNLNPNKDPFIEHIYRKKFMFYNPVEDGYIKHNEFHKLGKFAKFRMLAGGNRTGKTRTGCIETAQHLTLNYSPYWEGYKYKRPITSWVCGVTRLAVKETLERRLFDGMADEPPLISYDLIAKKIPIDHCYHIYTPKGISKVFFKSYEQGRDNFQGALIDLLHCDEEPLSYDIWTEAITRTMNTSEDSYGMGYLTMTPLKGTTKLITKFFQEERECENGETEIFQIPQGEVRDDRAYIVVGWEDALHLTDKEKQILIKSYSPHELEARTKGIPSIGSGLVYPVPEEMVTYCPSKITIPEHWPKVFGMDFGWKPSPTVALFAAHDRDNDVVYIYGEYGQLERTPQQHSFELMKHGVDWMPGVHDPAAKMSSQADGSKLINLYKECGVRNLFAADNSKEAGVLTVLQRMQNGKLKICKTLSKTLAEFRMYARDEKGIIKKGNDHYMDTLRYIIMSGLKVAKPKNLIAPLDDYKYGNSINSYSSNSGGYI
jgi:phage terminase large subunit-like protein